MLQVLCLLLHWVPQNKIDLLSCILVSFVFPVRCPSQSHEKRADDAVIARRVRVSVLV